MKAILSLRRFLFTWLCLLCLLAACGPATPTAGTGRGFAYIWYVSLTGDDDNTCAYSDDACRTVAGALLKAVAENDHLAAEYPDLYVVDHTINVAAGTYHVSPGTTGYPFARININVTLVGAGEDSTIFDSGDTYGGILVNGDVRVRLRNFTVQNVSGSAPDSCINVRGNSDVEIENVTVTHCLRYGISQSSTGPLSLVNVTSTGNLLDVASNGGGVYSDGDIDIQGGEFSRNEGVGLVIGGHLTMEGSQVDRNQRDGFLVRGTAELDRVQITRNGMDGDFRAGIFVEAGGDVTASNSNFENNQFGIWMRGAGASFTLIDSRVYRNPRTGIVVSIGNLHVSGSVLEDNARTYADSSLTGGVEIAMGASATIEDSQIINHRSGAIYNYGNLELTRSAITDNDGGLPAIFNGPDGNAVIDHSLIANNTRTGRTVTTDVAVENDGSMTMSNTTISGNEGSGLSAVGPLDLAYSTIAFNQDTGLLVSNAFSSRPTIFNVIVAGNGTDCYYPGEVSASAVLTGHNIDTDGSCSFPDSAVPTDLILRSLADNGGHTLTHALPSGSPAIDAASGACPSDDQRLAVRPFGSACDVGAYESGGVPISLETDLDLATVTPTPESPTITTTIETGCFFGPGEAWLRLDTLKAGAQAEVVGKGYGVDWLVVKHPTKGTHCWVNQKDVQFDFPLDQLRLIAIPEKPTPSPSPTNPPRQPTPKPTVCFYNAQNQYICQ